MRYLADRLIKRCCILLLFFCAGAPVLARPALVILLRHAEKPPEEFDIHDLSQRGRARAEALASLLTTNQVCTEFGPPVALFAPRFTPRGRARRPYETLQPLSEKLKIPIQTPYWAEDYATLAKQVLRDPAYDGKTVVICWVHEDLPQFAKKLEAKPPSGPWKGTVYDRLWVIRYRKHRAALTSMPQHLLPGDSAE